MLRKVCTKCNIEKELIEFDNKKGGKYDVRSDCKICRKEYQKEWYYKNIDDIREKSKQYHKKNKETINNRVKKWCENNNNKYKENQKKWRENNKEKIKEYLKEYNGSNRKKINENKKLYEKIKRNDSLYKLRRNITSLIRQSIKNQGYKKNTKTAVIIGCDYEFFKYYIESKFESWMSWDNYGKYNGELNFGWDYDHIIPISSAKTENDIIKLNHYTNLQPLCSYTNRVIKRANII
jgi:hypothetical protein